MKYKCKFPFENYDDCPYLCTVDSENIVDNEEIKLEGDHLDGKTDEDVARIEFIYYNFTKFPQKLTKIFPNLRALEIRHSNLKQIRREDLMEYKNFEKFDFSHNEFEILPGNLFENFINLREILFYENKLKYIESSILDGLEKLELLDFRGNINYNYVDTYFYHGEGIMTLEEFKNRLRQKSLKILQNYIDSNENLVQACQNTQSELEAEKTKNLQLTSGIFADIKTFIQDEATKDFKIIIDDREFPVHKFLLAARSPTLAEILRNNPEVENLNLVDIPVEIFEKILKFLYTDELPREDGTNFLHLFAAAGKLKIEKLNNFAVQKLIDEIDEENAMEFLTLSSNYNHEELRQKAFEKIKKKYPKIEFKDEWAEDSEKLTKIISFSVMKDELVSTLQKLETDYKNLIEN